MRRYLILVIIILSSTQTPHDWTKTARIADVDFWPDFTEEEIKEGIDKAHQQGISCVIAWVTSENIDIPQKDLDALQKAVLYTHQMYPDMKFIVYQAPLEIITENVDKNKDGLLDNGTQAISAVHPEWLQVGIDKRKAVFYGDFEFWIGEHDEDVWVCPNDLVYKEKIKESVKKLAETGIDGIWFDAVLFLCNYGDWDNNWACHCEDCQQKFYEDTGLTIPEKIVWNSTWKTWILWRQHCIEDFILELSLTAKEVNPDIKIIVEHWHGFDAESTENAWSPIGLQSVTDVLAHEYVSASQYKEAYTPVNYLRDIALYNFYRGTDKGHPSWVLAYSESKDGQKMLAASVLQAGCNFYDTVYPDMADSVSLKERTRIFHWVKEYSDYYYGVDPVSNVGVYYSKATIDFYDCLSEEWEGYQEFVGVSMMLLQLHIPYTVVTDLNDIEQFDVVLLPDSVCLSDFEKDTLVKFLENGGYVLAIGEPGYLTEWGQKRKSILPELSHSRFLCVDRLFGNEYYTEVNPFFWPEGEKHGTGDAVRKEFFRVLDQYPVLKVDTTASGYVVVLPFVFGNSIVYRVLNLEGVSPGDAVPDVQTISITSKRKIVNAFFIPFLSGPEDLDGFGSEVTIPVEDHCLVVLKVEPVSIFANDYDGPAAEKLAAFLRARGIPVDFVSSPEDAASVLIVFGGHKAVDTGEFVSGLLTDDEKTRLEQLGSKYLFIFQKDRLIIVIAGNEREDTAKLAEETRREVWECL
ncbi:MAG: hypothetical protein PVF58_01960 [Candidatus Methanofastidiosia archaeon]|jgi:hypothetical protein